MPVNFDSLFGNTGQPIRRDADLDIGLDADGNLSLKNLAAKNISISPDGAIDSLQARISTDRFYPCGCSAETKAGVKCQECGSVTCIRCARRCDRCKKPLCLEHANTLQTQDAQLTLCRQCHGTLGRKKFWGSLFKSVVSPFVELNDDRKQS